MKNKFNITKEEIDNYLPIALSDLKHHIGKRKYKNNKNIKRELYFYVIRQLFSKFKFIEKEKDSNKSGLFIKGYVHDIWGYLDSAYDLIHDERDYSRKKEINNG